MFWTLEWNTMSSSVCTVMQFKWPLRYCKCRLSSNQSVYLVIAVQSQMIHQVICITGSAMSSLLYHWIYPLNQHHHPYFHLINLYLCQHHHLYCISPSRPLIPSSASLYEAIQECYPQGLAGTGSKAMNTDIIVLKRTEEKKKKIIGQLKMNPLKSVIHMELIWKHWI